MSWLENLADKLARRVNKQLDGLNDQHAFSLAHDAYVAGDLKAALAGYEALAERKHGRAAALAGEMHLNGKGTKVNGAKALKYFELGKDAGDPDAIALLGMALAAGMAGIKIDYFKARPYLEAAVKNGDAKAKRMLDHVKAQQQGRRK
jgi:TPR repeat protein